MGVAAVAVSAICLSTTLNAQQVIIQTPEVRALREIKDPKQLQAKLKDLGKSGVESDYTTLYTYYQLMNQKLVDSVASIAVSKYPKGYVALNRASRKLNGKNLAQQEKLVEELKQEFPDQDFNSLYSYLIRTFVEQKNALGALKYLNYAKANTRAEFLPFVIDAAAQQDANATLAYLDAELVKPALTEKEKMILLYLQSDVLSNVGAHGKAFQAIKAYYDYTDLKSPELKASYYRLMSKAGRQAEALPYLEAAVLNRVGAEETKEELKNAYKKVNPDKDVVAYMDSLTKKLVANKKEELAKVIIREKAPAFSVTDAKGKRVSLLDFKGKIIVIDFWATWCGPCKRALPGMQATVKKFENDPKVAFLFIHTWEKKSKEADPIAAAKKYFADNNYGNLPLYMDLEDVNKVNPAVSAFKVRGIPAKFVIDGNGDIRFKKEGSGVDIDEIVAELSAMIDLAKEGSGK